MRRLLLSSVGVVTLALCSEPSPAGAADMAIKAPAPPAIYNWTGCYLGGNFGTVFAAETWTLASAPAGTVLSNYTTNGLLGGGQAGCNYQISKFVFGIQGDLEAMNASGTGTDAFNAALTDRSTISDLASVAGRFGYAWDRILFYGKGGGAWQRDKFDMFVTATNTLATSTINVTRAGWTVGGGIEYAITDHFLMFFEYDYYDFGNSTSSFVVPPAESVAIRESESVVKVGVNWKFGW
jgi:outer membrane immunogenic protein